MKYSFLQLVLLHIFLFSTIVVFGQDLEKEADRNYLLSDTNGIKEVVIQGNRLQIPFAKISRNIEIIQKKEISALPARTLNELLSYLNGVDLRQRGPFGTQADISVDGGSFEQTIVLINGVKFMDPQTGHHNLNLPIPLEAIERIEVLRGPASRIYGVNALTGAVNIVTKKIDRNALSAHLYSGSSFRKKDARESPGIYMGTGAQVGGQISKDKHKHQFYLTRESGNGIRYNTASEAYRLHYNNEVQVNDKILLEALGGYTYNAFGANGFYAAPKDVESREIVETIVGSLGTHIKLSERLMLSPRVSNRFNKDDYRFYRHDLSKGRSQHRNNVLGLELNGRYHTEVGDIGVGIESRFESINSNNIGDHDRKNHGMYAEFKTESLRNFLINAGAYVNYNTQFGWQVFPGIDVSYLLGSKWRFGANVGSSQRIPSFTDLYLNQRPGNVGNPNLKSENALQYEGLVKYVSDRLIFQSSYFKRDVYHFIDWTRESIDVPYQPYNLNKNTVRGFNTSIKYQNLQLGNTFFNLSLGYSCLHPSVVIKEQNLQSKYVLETLRNQLNAVVNLKYRSFDFSATGRVLDRTNVSAYYLNDLRTSYNFKGYTVYADVQNLWDVKYIEAGAVPMPGRWFSLGIRGSWF